LAGEPRQQTCSRCCAGCLVPHNGRATPLGWPLAPQIGMPCLAYAKVPPLRRELEVVTGVVLDWAKGWDRQPLIRGTGLAGV
jgi:hypothetical protein